MPHRLTELWTKIIGFGSAGLVSISLYLAPIYPLMALVGIMIFLDTYTGRWAARDKAKKEGKDERLEVSSKKTRDGLIPKIIWYNVVIITVYILDRFMLSDLLTHFVPTFPVEYSATKCAGLIMMWIEFDSIDENYYKVKGVRIKDIVMDKFKKLKKISSIVKPKKTD